jgi:hypothetical protein
MTLSSYILVVFDRTPDAYRAGRVYIVLSVLGETSLLLGFVAVRLIRHPERPEANGRIVIGLSALVFGLLGLVHIATGAPGRSAGPQALQDAGGLIGWAASRPLILAVGEVLAVPLLVLVTVFGVLVVTATPVVAIPRRLREGAVRDLRLGRMHDTEGELVEIVVDFDVAESFVVQGNPDTPAGINGFTFKPVLKLDYLEVNGEVIVE